MDWKRSHRPKAAFSRSEVLGEFVLIARFSATLHSKTRWGGGGEFSLIVMSSVVPRRDPLLKVIVGCVDLVCSHIKTSGLSPWMGATGLGFPEHAYPVHVAQSQGFCPNMRGCTVKYFSASEMRLIQSSWAACQHIQRWAHLVVHRACRNYRICHD